jgi:hypothetical protein
MVVAVVVVVVVADAIAFKRKIPVLGIFVAQLALVRQ